jgi:hypothetical protein
MIFDNYSRYIKKQGKKYVYTLEACTGHYEPIHRQGKRAPHEVPLYVTPKPDAVHCHSRREPALALSGAGGVYYSGLFIPDPAKPEIAFGDIGLDAIIFIGQSEQVELFIGKGKKPVSPQLFSMLSDGDPDLLAEIEEQRQKAKVLTNKGVIEDTSCPPSEAPCTIP